MNLTIYTCVSKSLCAHWVKRLPRVWLSPLEVDNLIYPLRRNTECASQFRYSFTGSIPQANEFIAAKLRRPPDTASNQQPLDNFLQ
jgi:hypothetical protein